MHIITALTGASGAIYGLRFIQEVNRLGHRQTVLISQPGQEVFAHELQLPLPGEEQFAVGEAGSLLAESWGLTHPRLIIFEKTDNLAAGISSGSNPADAMVIIPCTMGTAARLNQGLSTNLIERSFDVMLKENRKVIIVPRETPMSQIHLRNLLGLSQLGVDIIPAMPAFYHRPQQIDDLVNFLVGRVLEHLSLKHNLYQHWKG